MNRLQKMFLKLRNKNYRLAFMSARVAAAVGGQISSLRKKKEWTQDQLAQHAGMKRSRISLLESADYEGFSFTTLKRIAAAFDVAVIIQFVSFRDFVRWSESFNQAALTPESFLDTDRALRSEDLSSIMQGLSSGRSAWDQDREDAKLPPLPPPKPQDPQNRNFYLN
jgi:transcriptional regulator with XRE-family HTH domain